MKRALRANIMVSLYLVTIAILFSSETIGAQKLQQAGNEFNPNDLNLVININNVVKTTQQINDLKNSDIAEKLRESFLDFHRKGYENSITNFLRQKGTAKLNRNSQHSFQDRSLFNALQGVDDFLQDIYENNNFNSSSACVNDTARILIGTLAREKWVIPFLDSTGKPGPSLTEYRLNFVGNYKQCRDSVAPADKNGTIKGFRGNYCIIHVGPKNPALALFYGLQIGSCVPDTCTAEDLQVIVNEVLEHLNMTSTLQAYEGDCRNDEREFTTATTVAIVMICIIGAFMILGTFYDLLVIQRPRWNFFEPTKEDLQKRPLINGKSNNTEVDGAEETDFLSESKPLLPKVRTPSNGEYSTLTKVLLAFSVYTNGKKVLDTRQTTGSLGAVHGIRFLSMSWVILGHVYYLAIRSALNLLEKIPRMTDRWTFDVISNALPSVDTFFALSGLLTSYLTIKEMKKRSWKINWPLFYFHRFWRLTPPYMLALLIFLGLQRFMGSGALWPTVQPLDKKACEDSWWTNLLYVNNLVDMKEDCFGHTWYLANDMQFFVISPLMLIPFYFHRLAGFASCIVFLLVSWITTGVLSSQHDWPPTMFSRSQSGNVQDFMFNYYVKPWCRIGPFVIGMMTGYILAVTNGGKNIRMRWWMVVLGWLVATVSALAVIYGLRGDISGKDPSSIGAAALYNAVARSVWGACVCWVIIACVSGYGGFVNTILSWSPFVFLGRLTYMSYLIHLNLITVYFQNMDSLMYINETNMTITYLGALVFVNMAAFVSMLALESPMIGLEKALIRKERRD